MDFISWFFLLFFWRWLRNVLMFVGLFFCYHKGEGLRSGMEGLRSQKCQKKMPKKGDFTQEEPERGYAHVFGSFVEVS
jgi:hypothetical protein